MDHKSAYNKAHQPHVNLEARERTQRRLKQNTIFRRLLYRKSVINIFLDKKIFFVNLKTRVYVFSVDNCRNIISFYPDY